MPATTLRDLSALIAPISEASPVGTDPRGDTSAGQQFQSLRDSRNEARRFERQAADGFDENYTGPRDAIALWRTIAELSQKVLTDQAKDLEAACYLLEAWVRLDGFVGLRAGLALVRELCQQFWETMYPQPEDGEGLPARARFIDRLSGPLPDALLAVPITGGSSGGPFALWQYQQAMGLAKLKDRDREDRIRRGAITVEAIQRDAAETESQFFQTILADLDGSLEELRVLDAALLEYCGAADAPATSSIIETISEIQRAIRTLAGDRIAAAEAAEAAADESGLPSSSEAIVTTTAMGPLRTREDAFRVLSQVADFFERMDPQSLIAAHIRRILRLGKMSTVEYFTEILEDEAARKRLFKQLGLKTEE